MSDLQDYLAAQMKRPAFRHAMRAVECGEMLGRVRKIAGLTRSQAAKRLRTTTALVALMEDDPEAVPAATVRAAIALYEELAPAPHRKSATADPRARLHRFAAELLPAK